MRTSTFRHLLGAPACLLLAAATAVACQSSAPDRARDIDRPRGQTTYFAQYGVSTHAYQPRRLNPSVDGSLYVTGMQWTVWDDRQAAGDGLAHVNDCNPNCADGHYTEYRVTVRLARPRELCGSRFFTSIRVKGSGYHTYARRTGVACREDLGAAALDVAGLRSAPPAEDAPPHGPTGQPAAASGRGSAGLDGPFR